jgi:hypothetical protein
MSHRSLSAFKTCGAALIFYEMRLDRQPCGEMNIHIIGLRGNLRAQAIPDRLSGYQVWWRIEATVRWLTLRGTSAARSSQPLG